MNKIAIANWKMNKSLNDAEIFCKDLLDSNIDSKKFIISPPISYLAYLSKKYPNFNFASQNISAYTNFGSYTGEISAKIVKSCGVNYSIIGHSERRNYFNETDEIIGKKMISAFENDLIPILCIGDNNINNLEMSKNEIYRQIKSSYLSDKFKEYYKKKVIFAYEPLKSIGTGKIADSEKIYEILLYISKLISEVAKTYKIVYGGSVNSKNCDEILNLNNCSGLLIGKSSLDISVFKEILGKLC